MFFLWRLDGLQQVGESHDGIQRGTYLVSHIGQENRLLMTRIVGTICLLLQLLLLAHEGGDIAPYAKTAQQFTLLVVFGDAIELYPLNTGGGFRHMGMHLSDIDYRMVNDFRGIF